MVWGEKGHCHFPCLKKSDQLLLGKEYAHPVLRCVVVLVGPSLSLSLSRTTLSISIPLEIEQNNFSGWLPSGTIPTELGLLTHLTHLHLGTF
jgi:hypothetical protein